MRSSRSDSCCTDLTSFLLSFGIVTFLSEPDPRINGRIIFAKLEILVINLVIMSRDVTIPAHPILKTKSSVPALCAAGNCLVEEQQNDGAQQGYQQGRKSDSIVDRPDAHQRAD